jgi:hypothetical protein
MGILAGLCEIISAVSRWELGIVLPWSFRPMWRDEKPAAPQWVVSAMRNVIEDLLGHICGREKIPEVTEIN